MQPTAQAVSGRQSKTCKPQRGDRIHGASQHDTPHPALSVTDEHQFDRRSEMGREGTNILNILLRSGAAW